MRLEKSFLKKLLLGLAFFILILNAILLWLGNYYYTVGMMPKTHKQPEQTADIGVKPIHIKIQTNSAGQFQFKLEYQGTIRPEPIVLKSRYGYVMDGLYFSNPNGTRNTVLLVHGRSQNKWVSVERYGWLFLEKGFNILAIDLRFHGESGGPNSTFGWTEKYDLDQWVDFIRKINPRGIIGVHGESLGASVAILQSGINETNRRVSFYIADCPYSDLMELFKIRIQADYHVPAFPILYYADFITGIRAGFHIEDIKPIEVVKNVETPVLFIHGLSDKYIPSVMSRNMYAVKPGMKELYLVTGAGHAKSVYLDYREYQRRAYHFIDQVMDVMRVEPEVP